MRKALSVMLLVFLASMVGTITVNRSAGAVGVPQDLQALTTIVQNGFTAVQNALRGIQDSLNSLSAVGDSSVRFTPPVASVTNSGRYVCFVVNVANASRTVRAQLIDGLDGTVLSDTSDVSLAPGHTYNTSEIGIASSVYCKFTVVGGSRTDIRGTLGFRPSGSPTEQLSVPAE